MDQQDSSRDACRTASPDHVRGAGQTTPSLPDVRAPAGRDAALVLSGLGSELERLHRDLLGVQDALSRRLTADDAASLLSHSDLLGIQSLDHATQMAANLSAIVGCMAANMPKDAFQVAPTEAITLADLKTRLFPDHAGSSMRTEAAVDDAERDSSVAWL